MAFFNKLKEIYNREMIFFLVLALIVLLFDLVAMKDSKLFTPLIGLSLLFAVLPYLINFFQEREIQKELENRFPEFISRLVDSIKSGMSLTQAVVDASKKDFGYLTPYIKVLANQIQWAIPFKKAFINFGKRTGNKIIMRSISAVIEAEKAGGNVEDVLLSITDSLLEIKRIKQERKSSIYSQIIQNYIIFFVFLGVMILIQNMLVPYLMRTVSTSNIGLSLNVDVNSNEMFFYTKGINFATPDDFIYSLYLYLTSFNGSFLMLTIIQGIFNGLVIGLLSEGELKAGIKHAVTLALIGFIIISFAQSFLF